MTLDELFNQQQREIDGYKIARDQTWQKLKEEHAQISLALGGNDKVPSDIRQRMDAQVAGYSKEWSMYTGDRHKPITEQHAKQREALTGKPTPQPKITTQELKKNNNPLSDEKQQKLQKIIAQQQAIHARQQEPKRKR